MLNEILSSGKPGEQMAAILQHINYANLFNSENLVCDSYYTT